MLAIEVELLFGTVRAGSADDLAGSGSGDTGEWPLSPARLFSALVAADGTGARCRVTAGDELLAVEAAPAPRVVCDSERLVARSRLESRFVVVDKMAENTVQDYPARTSAEVRLGSRLSPRHPVLTYIWDGLDLPDEQVAALRRRAARIGYVGCSDSPARVRVSTTAASATEEQLAWVPDDDGRQSLPVPYEGFVADLDDLYLRFSSGEWVRRAWLPPVRTRYRDPEQAVAVEATGPVTVWLQFDGSIAGRHVLRVTETLRKALIELYDRHVLGGSGAVPSVLTGHGFTEEQWEQALYLALPYVGQRNADGRIHGAAVVLPASVPPEVVDGVRTALWHLRELGLPGREPIGLRLHDGEAKPRAAAPGRWERGSKRFVSAFPVVHEQFRKGGPSPADIARWCAHAGLPTPQTFRSARVPLLAGAVSLLPSETRREGRPARPFSHLEVTFAEEVTGPIVLGRARTFGLGLMAPLDERPDG